MLIWNQFLKNILEFIRNSLDYGSLLSKYLCGFWNCFSVTALWSFVVVVATTAQLYSTKLEFKLYAVLSPPNGLSAVRNGEKPKSN